MRISRKILWAMLPVIALMPVLLLAGPASSAQVTLRWVDSSSPGVEGYKIYKGSASREYTDSVDVGNTTSYTFSDLPEGAVFYFAATAYDAYGNESAYSNEVIRDFRFGTSPVIYSLSVTQGVEGTSITIAGDNFGTKKGYVYVGARKAKIMSWSPAGNSVVFLSPKRLPYETYEVGLITADKARSANTKLYRVMQANITGASAVSGLPGDKVTLTGEYFGPRPKVYFSFTSEGKAMRKAAKVTGYSVKDYLNSNVEFRVPDLDAGQYDLTVVNSQGISSNWNFEVK